MDEHNIKVFQIEGHDDFLKSKFEKVLMWVFQWKLLIQLNSKSTTVK